MYSNIINCLFIGNTVLNQRGGAIYIKPRKGSIDSCTFKDNDAKTGASIYYDKLNTDTFYFVNNKFEQCNAIPSSKGIVEIYWTTNSNFNFQKNTFTSTCSKEVYCLLYSTNNKGTPNNQNAIIKSNCYFANCQVIATGTKISKLATDGFSSNCAPPTQTPTTIITIEKHITFYPNGYYEININAPQNYAYFVSPGMRPNVESDAYIFKGVIIKESDNTITTIEDGDAKEQTNFKASTILAAVDRYYTTLFFKQEGNIDSIILNNSNKDPMPFISANGNISLSGYIGPKDHRVLESINPSLTDVIEYGIITFFAKPLFLLLDTLYKLTGNWGWAIILLTLIVRIVLYPLTYKGMVSMQKLKDLAPKLKEIQAKYKGEPQKLQAHMMELYKKHGANPMGGCLPLLLQLPVFFAIYRVLYNAIELKGAGWLLWIQDLSVMDPYFVLPILMGLTMFLQQHLTPTTFSDPMQEKIFKFLPLIFTIFFVTFPSGLVLYWFVNNVFSILQQLAINKSLAYKKSKEIAEHKHRPKDS